MSTKDHKIAVRRNIDEIKGMMKVRHTNIHKEKENLMEYLRKQKSKSSSKNPQPTVNPTKAPTTKKSNTQQLDFDPDFNYKKLKTQADIIVNRRSDQSCKPHFNMTLNSKKDVTKDEKTKRGEPSGYFMTADVSSVLKAINKNMKLDNSLQRKRVNMMTEEDVERLFEKDNTSNCKRKSQSKAKDLESRMRRDKRGDTQEDLRNLTHKVRLDEKSRSKDKRKAFLQTDPDIDYLNQSQKMETMKLNLKQMMEDEPKQTVKKDFAQSIKFLQITEDSNDKLLSALKDEGLVKVEADPSIDKTTKFKEEFVVGKQIGEGAYASVRLAIHKPEGKKVAIKIYQKKKIKEIQRRKSVRRQIKILQKIDHKNILKIYDVIETNNHVNIIMEYIPGTSLNTYLKSQPSSKASEKDARRIFTPLVQAIRYLHSLCICHRDIKLENILLDSKLSPKLIDFGFSTCIEHQKKVKMFCGTPSYMAPQIVVKKEYKGAYADIWALGVLLYVILTGIFPFKGHTDKQLYQKICTADYPKLTGVSRTVENLIQCMLTIDPERRITADEILQHEWISCSVTAATQTKMSEDASELHTRFQQLLNMTKYRKTQEVICSSEKQGFAQTYKQNILRYELNKVTEKQPSPRLTKQPRTCTNRESHRIQFGDDSVQKSSSKLLELLKSELRRKDQSPEPITPPQPEQRLTNKRYF